MYRDEVITIHTAYDNVLGSSKDKTDRKKASEVQEMAGQALQHA